MVLKTWDLAVPLLWKLPTSGLSGIALFRVLQICPKFKDGSSHTQLKTGSSLCRSSRHLLRRSWCHCEPQLFFTMVFEIERVLIKVTVDTDFAREPNTTDTENYHTRCAHASPMFALQLKVQYTIVI